MTQIKREIIINASPEKAFDVITDFESYPDFLPEMKDVTIESKGKKEIVATFKVQLIKSIEYTLRFTLNRPNSISWIMIEGEVMKKNRGSWKLKALGKEQIKATYSIEVGFGPLVPKSITDKLIGGNLPTMLENFKDRIEN